MVHKRVIIHAKIALTTVLSVLLVAYTVPPVVVASKFEHGVLASVSIYVAAAVIWFGCGWFAVMLFWRRERGG